MSLLPSPWRARGWAVLVASFATVASLGGVGCYKPNIRSGSFVCNTGYKEGSGDCPGGCHCVGGLCVNGTPVLVEPPPDATPAAHPDAVPDTKPDLGPDGASEVTPICNLSVMA